MAYNKNEVLKTLVEACLDGKGFDLSILEVKDLTILADYFVIVSGRSHLHVRSIAENVITELETYGITPLRKEGLREGTWVVLDYGFIILHIFREQEREYYNLESLWGHAPRLSLSQIK
ncbi:ribosome-associated protein [Thermosyntropha lipolytica DSM 11003]|uniref:Ribosomal silencing factor RsfS n=1 Tax=Thermosyntropha lipolytica DSM 11003 TaxID=1123382 RepID=A0A1M5R2R5_9FIRM|nr:ribosome silencing factor [Thermosyntropha lipolytica]SHH20735.1 ribosome-associated protein [Thermosyntropha lipolytica DSM 11003]